MPSNPQRHMIPWKVARYQNGIRSENNPCHVGYYISEKLDTTGLCVE